MPLSIRTSAFKPAESIPRKYTCDGPDVSPDLKWTGAPTGTRSFALICDDPDAPVGLFTHWVLYALAVDAESLPEGLPKDSELKTPRCLQGVNDFRRTGYGGPCPPPGSAHRYYFRLYALDYLPDLPAGASRSTLEQAMRGHILEQAETMGTYRRG